jgi:chorismate mutase
VTWRTALHRALRVPSVRAIRGATAVPVDSPDAIAAAVEELVHALQRANGLRPEELISAIFTVTPDLQAAFPAEAARAAGWEQVPLLCTTEIAVPGSLPRCLRVLLHVGRHWNGTRPTHVYLHEATVLRPDLVTGTATPGGA